MSELSRYIVAAATTAAAAAAKSEGVCTVCPANQKKLEIEINILLTF